MHNREYSSDAFNQQKLLIRNEENLTIFDVGACIGEISLKYRSLFPESELYAFEPYYDSFIILEQRLISLRKVHMYNFAFSNVNGKSQFNCNKFPPTNSLLESSLKADHYWGEELLDTIKLTNVETKTIDDFCYQKSINKIDILKLDTQGSEYMILEGARSMLKNNLISMIYMEVILVETYKNQKLLSEITDFLDQFNYRIFNIYNPRISENRELNQVDIIFLPKGA
ncbi:MAG: hypothetical protein CVU00_14930 [Bacteroidetes bacterium HGW-Bacteroidetes-17]|jgi:FkbM family methyltransferase|nr:MAG: hypothetical protein CVU00_14930 [Bacteroidetes bacterium HGW-Bacteroidetes-17]